MLGYCFCTRSYLAILVRCMSKIRGSLDFQSARIHLPVVPQCASLVHAPTPLKFGFLSWGWLVFE